MIEVKSTETHLVGHLWLGVKWVLNNMPSALQGVFYERDDPPKVSKRDLSIFEAKLAQIRGTKKTLSIPDLPYHIPPRHIDLN